MFGVASARDHLFQRIKNIFIKLYIQMAINISTYPHNDACG